MTTAQRAFALHAIHELEEPRLVTEWKQRKREQLERIRAIRDAEGASPGLFAYARAIGVSTDDLQRLGLRGFGERA